MQRECNDVAFGELILSTGLNKKKKIHPMSKIKDVVEACNSWTCRCRKGSPPQEGIAFTTVLQRIARVFTNQYINSSNTSLALETLNMTITVRCVKPAKEKIKRSLLQDGKQENMWWRRRINSHWLTWKLGQHRMGIRRESVDWKGTRGNLVLSSSICLSKYIFWILFTPNWQYYLKKVATSGKQKELEGLPEAILWL